MKKRKRPTSGNIQVFISLYSDGLSTRETENKTGFSHTTVRKYLVLSGIQLRDKSTAQKGKPRPYAVKETVSKPCPICGTDIVEKPGRINRRTYCSYRCNGIANAREKKPLPRPTLVCEQCGKKYKPKEVHEAKIRRFCSHPCSRTWNAINITGNTEIELIVQSWLDELSIEYETQYPISKFLADIFLPEYDLVIECDGTYWHSLPGIAERDRMRNIIMRRMGYSVLRLPESDIKNHPEQCKKAIFDRISNN